MADRTIQIIVDVADKTNGKLDGIKNSLLAMDKAAQRMNNRLKALSIQKYAATIRLIDRVTEPGGRINSFLRNLASKAYNLSIRLNDGALGKIRQIEAGVMRLTGRAYTVAVNLKDNVSGKMKGLTEGAMMGAGVFAPIAGAAGIGFGAANALGSYMDFEKQMSQVQAVRQLEKTSDEMKALTQQAKDLGAATAWTRKEVGEAQYYQALAGWETEDILKVTPHILNLASAANMPLGRASDIVTDTMTAFALKPTDTYVDKQGRAVSVPEQYIDMLAKLQAVSNTSVEQASGALKYSANLFGAMSSNLTGQERIQFAMDTAKDVMIMTGLMANAGIKESMAGTGMSNIAQRMTSGNRNAYYALGLTDTQIEDAQHNILPFNRIIKQLNKAFHEGMDVDKIANFVEEMSGQKIHADTRRKLNKLTQDVLENGGKMGTADMMQLSTMLGGAEHAHKLMALIMGDWDAMQKKMEDVHGTAEGMAKTQLDNLAGEITILGSAWDAFQQGFFEGQAGAGLRDFVKTLTDIVSRANKLFSDGIQLGDIGKVIFDIIGRLKNKFLELDGVGSILAGGALMAGLMKIATTAQRAIGYFRQLRGLEIGQRLGGAGTPPGTPPTTRGAIPPGQSVGTMHVNAGVVNINGKVTGGAGGTGGTGGSGGSGGSRGATPPSAIVTAQNNLKSAQASYDKALAAAWANPGSRWQQQVLRREQTNLAQAEKSLINARVASYNTEIARQKQIVADQRLTAQNQRTAMFGNMRSAAGGAAAFSAIFGLLDVMNARAMGQERLADAKAQIELAKKDYAEQKSHGAGQEVLAEYAKKISDAQAAQAQIVRENQAAEFKAGTEATGAVLGSALGAALGSLAGPMGTMIGGIVGGMIGQKLGGEVADSSEGIRHEPARREVNGAIIDKAIEDHTAPPKTFEFKNPLEHEERDRTGLKRTKFFEAGEQIAATTAATQTKVDEPSVADFRHANEVSYSPEFRRAQREARDAADHARWQREFYGGQSERTRSDFSIKADDSFDYYARQREALTKTNAETVTLGDRFKQLSNFFDGLLFSKAAAAELSPEQLAQQTAMERGETIAPTPEAAKPVESPELTEPPELNLDGLTENLFSQFEQFGEGITEMFTGLGESISEGLTSTFEGVGEIFSAFGENVMTNLTAAFEGAGEVFTTFGETITAGLTTVFDGATEIFAAFGETISAGLTAVVEGAGEIFSGLGEMITAGLDAALSSATSALEGIQSAFMSAKESIQSAWAELPGFFGSIFAGLGDVAASAGAAIAAGLTAPIGGVVSAWESAAAQISAIISNISAMSASVSTGGVGGGGTGKAEGGFVSAETHFFAGEHGPEVVIPLSSSRRARALDLFEKTAAILGGDAPNFTGDEMARENIGVEPADSYGIPANENVPADTGITPNQSTSTANNSIDMGGLNVTFQISGAENPQEVMDTIKENLAELADKIAGQIAKSVGAIHENQCLEG